MKKALLILVPLFLLLTDTVFGQEIVVLLDAERPHYLQVLQGFQTFCLHSPSPTTGVKSIHTSALHRIIIADKGADQIAADIRAYRPDLILAIGNRGLEAAMTVPEVPVVYLLVSQPARLVGNRANITGIELRLSAALQLAAMREHLPKLKRLGVIYDPLRTGDLIAEATIAAPQHGITLLARPLGNRSDIPQLLKSMQTAKLDGYWLIPDLTVMDPTTLPNFLLFSLANKIPLITFSDKYLQDGAAVSITFDMLEMGSQAGKIASAILCGTPASAIPPQPAQQALVKHNPLIVKKLGVTFLDQPQKGGER